MMDKYEKIKHLQYTKNRVARIEDGRKHYKMERDKADMTNFRRKPYQIRRENEQ